MERNAQPDAPQGPHPLATALATALPHGARVLVVGAGDGRNRPPLRAAGLLVEEAAAADALLAAFPGPYAGVLSTHGLLHGTRRTIEQRLGVLATRLAPGGRLHATFGSTSDPRCGTGTPVEGDGWSPRDGEERGVPHAYFDTEAIALALRAFRVLRAHEQFVGDVVGRWAHPESVSRRPSVHWFVEALRA